MEVRFTPEQLAQLDRIATNAGTDAEHLVKNAALRLLEDNAEIPAAAPRTNGELPLFSMADEFSPFRLCVALCGGECKWSTISLKKAGVVHDLIEKI
jgi:hypothetical protein